MKKNILFFILLYSLVGCEKKEELALQEFPANNASIAIYNTDGSKELSLNAVYDSKGELQLEGPIKRTYTVNFLASPKDTKVSFEVLSNNIPEDLIVISPADTIIPAGYTEARVTLSLKNDDISFAQTNYDKMVYELGVKATIDGFKFNAEPIQAKITVNKEAYIASCYVEGEKGNTYNFERGFVKGTIVNPDPIAYNFKVKLDKPARKDVTIKFSHSGIAEEFMKDITITPSEVTIPAGELVSEDINWTITDDFLLQTALEEQHAILVSALATSEDPVVGNNTEMNFLTLNVHKIPRNFEYVEEKVAAWQELSKTGWSVQIPSGVTGQGSFIIDGRGGATGQSIYRTSDYWFTVDMKEVKNFTGLSIDYYRNSGTASSPKKIKLFTSDDNENWELQGEISTPQSYNHYLNFFVPVNAQYLKVDMSGLWNRYLEVTEIYLYTE